MMRAATRCARLRAFVVGAAVVLLTGCGDATDEPGDASATASRLERLWLRPPVASLLPAPDDDAGELLVDGRFDGAQTWYRLRSPLDPSGEVGMTLEATRPAKEALGLRTEPGFWGVAAMLPVRAGEALSVEVAGRGLRPNLVRQRDGSLLAQEGTLDVATLVELREPLDPDRPLTADEAQGLVDRRQHAIHMMRAEEGAFDVRTDLVTGRLTRALLVVLLAPNVERADVRVFDSVTVRRRGVSAHAAAGGELPGVQRLADSPVPGAVRVTLDREERQGLLAPLSSSWTWELPPEATRRRTLTLALGLEPRAASLGGAVRFVVRAAADGAALDALRPGDDPTLLLDETLTASDDPTVPAWRDRRIVLPPSPRGSLRLEIATRGVGEDPPLAFVGNPLVQTAFETRPPNVLLVSLDTLRPDRLGCYGGDPALTPRLDALASQGLRFTNAFSTSSYTLPSHGSMLTGQFPAFHGAVNIDDALSPERSPFLARILADAGFSTTAFTGGGYVDPAYGFAYGFDRYSVNDPVWAYDSLRGRMLLDKEHDPTRMPLLERYDTAHVVDWISEHADDGPFFLFLHTYIAHNYAPDRAALARAGLLSDGPVPERPFDHKRRERFNAGELDLRDQVYDEYMPYYDATIGMADAFVGRVLDALDASGHGEDTLVVVTSDHGEEFGEHDFFGHGETLFEGATRIPLFVRAPGPAAARVASVEDGLVSLVDVAPLVLRTLGMEPDRRMAVRPPLGPRRELPPARDFVVMELDNLHDRISAWREPGWELQVRFGEDGHDFARERPALFDLSQSPTQERDVRAGHVDVTERLRGQLRRFHELAESVHPRDGGSTDYSGMDVETLNNLAALGYLSAEQLDAILRER
ncbi:MAG: sulfatase [Planctomycetes bacterium]|nr:sulfatase [Planctomycetota bacterium]